MKAVIRLIQVILTAVWLALLAVCVLLFVSAGDGGLPGIGGWRCFTVTGSSMSPELSPGDLAVIRMGGTPKAGDVVLCTDSAGAPELTRIIGTSEGQLILKPDGLEESRLASPDEPDGVYAGYLPGFGEPFRFLCSLPVVIAVAAAGLILIVLPGFLLHTPKAPKPPRPPRRPPARPAESRRTQPSTRPQNPRQGGYTPRH